MRVTINKPEDSIDLSMVTEDMYFVGVDLAGAKHLLVGGESSFAFFSVGKLTKANPFCQEESLQKCLKEFIGEGYLEDRRQLHAFHTYQEAFKFIAENL